MKNISINVSCSSCSEYGKDATIEINIYSWIQPAFNLCNDCAIKLAYKILFGAQKNASKNSI